MAHAGCGGARLAIVGKITFARVSPAPCTNAQAAPTIGTDHDDIAVVHDTIQQKGSSGLDQPGIAANQEASPRIVGMIPASLRV